MLFESFAYVRDAVAAGEYWRLPASSIAHLSFGHLTGNLLAAAGLVFVLRRWVTVGRSLAILAVGAFGVGLGVHFATTLAWYAGLSGAIHALIAHGTLVIASGDRWRLHGSGLFAACALKIAFDQSRTLSWLGEPLAPQSHLWGFATGIVAFFALASLGRLRVGAFRMKPRTAPRQKRHLRTPQVTIRP